METGQCPCKPGVIGRQCNRCDNPFAEVTVRGCEGTSCPARVPASRAAVRDQSRGQRADGGRRGGRAAASWGSVSPAGWLRQWGRWGLQQPKRAPLLLDLCQYDSQGLGKRKESSYLFNFPQMGGAKD